MRANYQVNATPQFRVLSEDQIEEIFHAALEVLSRVGTRVYHSEALALLRSAGCTVQGEDLVRIPAWLVQEALTTAPRRIVLRGRDRARRIALEKDQIYFGTGSDCPVLIDPYTDQVRNYTFDDVYNAARIADALPNVDFHMSLGLTSGVPAQTYDRHQFLAMLKGTSKPLVITAVDREGLEDQYCMACEVLGGEDEFSRLPLFAVYNEPVSPLGNSPEAIGKLLFAADKRIPALYTPGTTCGATAPATLAGGMVQGLAEYLAGLVMAQLKRRGAPLIMGGVTTVMDMSTSIFSYGSPELVLISAAMTDVAKWLRLPMFSTAGCSDAKALDQQAAVEASVSVTVAALSGANLIHDVGYLESGRLGSFDMLVLSDEVISMVKRIMRGITVTPETLAVDVIERVGPGGHYLTQEHTRTHFRSEMWFPGLIDRQMRREWEASGSRTMGERVRAKVLKILETHQPLPIAPEMLARLEAIVAQADERHRQD